MSYPLHFLYHICLIKVLLHFFSVLYFLFHSILPFLYHSHGLSHNSSSVFLLSIISNTFFIIVMTYLIIVLLCFFSVSYPTLSLSYVFLICLIKVLLRFFSVSYFLYNTILHLLYHIPDLFYNSSSVFLLSIIFSFQSYPALSLSYS